MLFALGRQKNATDAMVGDVEFDLVDADGLLAFGVEVARERADEMRALIEWVGIHRDAGRHGLGAVALHGKAAQQGGSGGDPAIGEDPVKPPAGAKLRAIGPLRGIPKPGASGLSGRPRQDRRGRDHFERAITGKGPMPLARAFKRAGRAGTRPLQLQAAPAAQLLGVRQQSGRVVAIHIPIDEELLAVGPVSGTRDPQTRTRSSGAHGLNIADGLNLANEKRFHIAEQLRG